MADLSTKKDPLHLREEHPDYVQDTTGSDDPEEQPEIGTDPMDLPSEGQHKPHVHLDGRAVRRAEEKGEGM